MAKNMSKVKFTYPILMLIAIIIIIPKIVFAGENSVTNSLGTNQKEIKLGDINGDGKINIGDTISILRHISATSKNNHTEWVLKDNKFKAADITGNNKIDTGDILVIMRYIAANNNTKVSRKHKEWLEIGKETKKETEEIEEIPEENIEIEEKAKAEENSEKVEKEPEYEENKEDLEEKTEEKVINNGEAEEKEINKEESKQKEIKEDNDEVEIKQVKVQSEKKVIPKTIKVTGIKLNKKSSNLEVGKTLKLKATITPTNATNKNITWSSSNKEIATVDKNGKVTAKKKGTVTITAKTKDGGKKETCKITVKANNKKTNKITSNVTTTKTTAKKITSKATTSNKSSTTKKSTKTNTNKAKSLKATPVAGNQSANPKDGGNKVPIKKTTNKAKSLKATPVKTQPKSIKEYIAYNKNMKKIAYSLINPRDGGGNKVPIKTNNKNTNKTTTNKTTTNKTTTNNTTTNKSKK